MKERINTFYYSRKKDPALPKLVMIEPTSMCNLRCSMCYVQQHIKTRRSLSSEDFCRIIDAFTEVRELIFCGIGEPLLNNDLFTMIKESKNRGIPFINLVTNGKLLSEDTAERIIRLRVNRIQISVHSFNPSLFSQIRNDDPLSLGQIKDNIKRLVAIKRELNSPLKVCCNAVVNKFNYNDMLPFIRAAKELDVDRVEFIQMTTANDNLKEINAPLTGMAGAVRAARNLAKKLNIELSFLSGNSSGRCYQLWDFIMIHADGNISPCNGIFPTEDIGVGNILKEPVEKIWVSEKYRQLRRLVAAGKLQNCRYCESGYCLEGINLTWIKNYYFRPIKRILKKILLPAGLPNKRASFLA